MKKQSNSKITALLIACLLTSGLMIQGHEFSRSAQSDAAIETENAKVLTSLSNPMNISFSESDKELRVYAGEDVTVCIEDYIYQLNGTCTISDQILWETSGDGEFSDPTNLNSIYTPGDYDTSSGQVTLYLYVNNPNYDGPPVFDVIVISYISCTIPIPVNKDF